MSVHVKRVYEDAHEDDGVRILVDRIWPRGVSKEDAALDDWMKEISPTTDLRKWFNHDPKKFADFKQKYKEELTTGTQRKALDKVKAIARERRVTLVYAAKNEKYNQAVVLKEILDH
ncbi:MAG TPA: DUF488 domain-containing protein [Bacillota bacterium]|nr:DUF488 domain-containing protein [Bacillota bacterium]